MTDQRPDCTVGFPSLHRRSDGGIEILSDGRETEEGRKDGVKVDDGGIIYDDSANYEDGHGHGHGHAII